MTSEDARCAIAAFRELYPLLYRVARAIETYEGNSQNNPGNLRYSPFGERTYTGFALFDNYHTGFVALLYDLRSKATGRTITGLGPDSTLEELMHIYAPPSENDTISYLRFLESKTELPAATRLGDLL